ncbi:type II secretion system protein GspM [Delftia acidovorans]|uniref:type II secretion system protein GspM n=2 Tax=Delftia acidovorans TaxID=80866 RepID=UPI00241D4525|nr:type II secretion system protein GspM [Delftia acidovorans]
MKIAMSVTLVRQLALLGAIVLLVAVPVGVGGWWVHGRHQAAQEALDTINPRYARLLGMRDQEDEIRQALAQVAEIKAKHIYPGELDATQTGNGLQQKLRSMLDGAGLSVVSSQVKPVAEDGAYERISVAMTAEGEWPAIQLALVALKDISPTVWLDDLEISLQGSLMSNDPKAVPKLSAQFMFSILRSKIS